MKLFKITLAAICACTVLSCSNGNDSVEIHWLPDRTPSSNPLSLFGDIPQNVVDSLGIQDGVPSSISTVLVKSDGETILFDTGLGAPDSQLLPSLDSLGVDAAELDKIYLTHLHGDHIGGLMNPQNFPKAEIWLSRVEFENWKNMPSGNGQQLQFFEIYADRLHLFEFGDSLAGKVQTFEAGGHTPGHTVFQVGKYLIIGDLMHGAALQMAYPDYCARYDQDPEAAVASRKKYIAYARENGLTMTGMHLPEPGFIEAVPSTYEPLDKNI